MRGPNKTHLLEDTLTFGESDEFGDIKDLAGGALVTFVGKIGRLSRAAFLGVVAVFCGLEVVGAYSVAWGFVSTANRLARFGLHRGVVHFITAAGARSRTLREQDEANAALGAALLIGTLASAVVVAGLWLATDWVAAFYHQPDQLPIGESLLILAWSAPFITAAWVFVSATRALRIMRYAVYVFSIAGPLVLLAGSIAIALLGGDADWQDSDEKRVTQLRYSIAVAWLQLGMAVGVGTLAAHFFRKHFSLWHSLKQLAKGRAPVASMARFSAPVSLADFMFATLTQLDVLMLGKFVTMAEVGIYSVARRIASSMLKGFQALDPIFSSVVSELSHSCKEDQLARRFIVISRWLVTINLPIFAFLFIVGDSVLQWTGSKWLAEPTQLHVGLKILYVLSIGMFMQGVFAVIEPLLAMTGRPGLNLVNNSFWVIGNFLLNLWLIRKYGVVGAAYGATVSMFFVNVLRVLEVWFLHRIRPFDRSQAKPLLAAAVAAGVAYASAQTISVGPAAGVLLNGCAYLIAYLIVLSWLGLEPEDRLLLERAGRRLRLVAGGNRSH